MRNQLLISSLFLLFLLTPNSRVSSSIKFYRLYYGSRCPYSLRIMDAWNQFNDQHSTASWDCHQMVCRFPTPTLIVFENNTIQDIHVGSDTIMNFIHETLLPD